MISKFSIAGMIAGLIFAIGSFTRYYIIYQDLSEVVIGVSLGLCVFGISFLYNSIIQLRKENLNIKTDYLAFEEKVMEKLEERNNE